MNKAFYESKTIWGAGLLGLTMIGQHLGWLPSNVVVEVWKVLIGFLGVYGLRSAID